MKASTILVTGGTGSFGHAFVKRALSEDPEKIIIFSRDEEKQHKMRLEFNNEKLVFQVGDVRDRDRVFQVMQGVTHVFHAAALKQVPSCEFFPLEAVKTNILGTTNVLDAAIANNVESVVCLSTDKAVYPINAMGMSKALMEKIAISKAKTSEITKISVTRYGNVMMSRGSIIPIFVKNAKMGEPLTVTNPDMTRFLMSLDEAVDLVLYAMNYCTGGEVFVKKAPACTILDLAKSVNKLFGDKSEIKIIGTRHGEKMHEALVSCEEMKKAEDHGEYYVITPDTRGLDYNLYFSQGEDNEEAKAFTSENTSRLRVVDVVKVLKNLDEVQDALEKR